jgi:hypothetical protein
VDCAGFGCRSCILKKAVVADKNGNDELAFHLVLLALCDKPEVQQSVLSDGQQAVADHLRGELCPFRTWPIWQHIEFP